MRVLYSTMLELAKLYATITYFHPNAGAAWAEATEKYFPEVLRQPRASALSAWLGVLGDPETAVVLPDAAQGTPLPGYTASTAEGWLVLFLPDINVLIAPNGEALLTGFLSEAARASGVIFDLRGSETASSRAVVRFDQLTAGLARPATLQRVHYGKVPEVEPATGDFRTGWLQRDAILTARRWPRTVFLVGKNSQLPSFAHALVQLGRGAVFSADSSILHGGAPSVLFPLGNGQQVRVSVGLGPTLPVILSPEPLVAARAWLKAMASPEPLAWPRATTPALPPPQTRLHAALRLWSAIWLLHPSRSAIQRDWEQAWPGFLSQVLASTDAAGFHRAVRRLLTHTKDGHALTLTPLDAVLFGQQAASVRLQTVEGRPTVVAVRHPAAAAGGIQVGDVVVSVEGTSITRRRQQLTPYLAAGTPQARENYINNRLLLGKPGSLAELTLSNGRRCFVPRLPTTSKERQGEVVRTLAGGVGYADLDRLTHDELAPFFQRFQMAPGLVFDLRGYIEELVWELAPYLASDDTLQRPAVRFVRPVALPPEEGELTARSIEEVFLQRLPSRAGQRRYSGKVVVLIDERTQSQAEHSVLFLQACGARLVGSPTAGAVGDVTNIALSEGIVVRFSGQEVRTPAGNYVAGVGIAPDIRVRPTVRGLRAGQDEVLEAAVKAILSRA